MFSSGSSPPWIRSSHGPLVQTSAITYGYFFQPSPRSDLRVFLSLFFSHGKKSEPSVRVHQGGGRLRHHRPVVRRRRDPLATDGRLPAHMLRAAGGGLVHLGADMLQEGEEGEEVSEKDWVRVEFRAIFLYLGWTRRPNKKKLTTFLSLVYSSTTCSCRVCFLVLF